MHKYRPEIRALTILRSLSDKADHISLEALVDWIQHVRAEFLLLE